ncbi:SlyX family protein [Simplicispira hankyongi]|uniref:SlyX protein n=1 Tax=Simplicispira hankyongi TaxID=2315688 RepID=A0A398CEP1_9BURK|nr:SlyX family protein [Simplicispira hankyongi]RID99377.1 SlyX protein [Simplicispira hankyongi]
MREANNSDQRFESLEVKLSYLEDLVDGLNLNIYRQQEQIDRLARELVQLRQQAPGAEGGERNPRDEMPPHY